MLFAMIHVMLFEAARSRLDIDFLKHRGGVALPGGAQRGFYLRDPDTRQAAGVGPQDQPAVVFDTPASRARRRLPPPASRCCPTGTRRPWGRARRTAAPSASCSTTGAPSPRVGAGICDVPAATIRRIANEYLDHAEIGATIEIEGKHPALSPGGGHAGKTVNNGWGGYDCCWARTLMACLVGALDVPGGTIGTAVRLNRPANDRQSSAKPGGRRFMDYPFNPTDKENWISRPQIRNPTAPWCRWWPTRRGAPRSTPPLAWMFLSVTAEVFPSPPSPTSGSSTAPIR